MLAIFRLEGEEYIYLCKKYEELTNWLARGMQSNKKANEAAVFEGRGRLYTDRKEKSRYDKI